MAAKTAVIWVTVGVLIVLILYISYKVYQKYIAKYFENGHANQNRSEISHAELAPQQAPICSGQDIATAPPVAPGYVPQAPPTYSGTIQQPDFSSQPMAPPPSYEDAVKGN